MTNMKRGIAFAAVVVLLLITACGGAKDGAAAGIVGRWQRTSTAGPGDPNETSAEYIEFRKDGALLGLLRDGDAFWLIWSASYTIAASDKIEVSGTCYKGWERYPCTRAYDLMLEGDTLTITGDYPAEYQRIGDSGPDLPPTLAPPMPSAAPPGG